MWKVVRALFLATTGGHHMILTHETGVGFTGDVGALLVGLLRSMGHCNVLRETPDGVQE